MLMRVCLVLAVLSTGFAYAEVLPVGEDASKASSPASQPNGGPPAEHPMFRTSYTVSAGVAQQFTTGLDPQGEVPQRDGSFSLTRAGLGVGIHYPLAKGSDWIFDHGFSFERDWYDFSGQTNFSRDFGPSRRTIVTNEPWDSTYLASYSLRATYLINRDWSVFASPIIASSFEDGADLEDSLSYGVAGGIRQQVNRDFGIGLGVIARRDLSEQYSFLPMVLIDWKINDSFSVRNGRSQPGLRGTAGVELVWSFGKFELAGGGTYDRREFRLDDEGWVLARGGIGQNSSYPVYLRLNYMPSEKFTATLLAGYLLGGELRLENKDGSRFGSTDYESAPFVGAGISYQF